MNKIYLHLLILAMFVPAIVAQAKLPPLQFEAGAGLSQPLFAYASSDLNKGCFTMSGLQLSGVASVGLSGPLWLEARFDAQFHPVNVSRLGYERVIADPFLTDTYIRSEPYRHFALLAGPAYIVPFGRQFTAQASVFAGFMQSKTPHQLHKPTYFMTGPEYFEISSAIDYAFGYGAEIGAGWKATSCYHLKLSASFLHADMDFRFRTASGIRIDSRSISTINLRAGVVFLIPAR